MSEQPQDAMEAFQEPTSWPKVIGIISMIWGGFGLTCASCGIAGAAFSTSMLPPEMKNGPLPPGMGVTPQMAIQTGLGILMSIVLFSAGLMTLRRQMLGRTLHLVWSIASLIMIPVSFVMMMYQQAAMQQWIKDNPDSPFAKGPGAGSNVGLLIGSAFIVIFAIYPIFIFIWFLFIKKTKESFGAEAVKDYI